MKGAPPFSRIFYYGIYAGVLKEAIHLLKFGGIRRLSEPLSALLSGLPLPAVQGILPVPLHKKRLREREFNQTALIGRSLGKNLRVPLIPDSLRKERETLPQTDVTGRERVKNVKGAFRVVDTIKGLDLLLVDDVITTGSTVRECAKVLVKAGAKSVTVVALARSMPKQNR
jgi:ComF family protein